MRRKPEAPWKKKLLGSSWTFSPGREEGVSHHRPGPCAQGGFGIHGHLSLARHWAPCSTDISKLLLQWVYIWCGSQVVSTSVKRCHAGGLQAHPGLGLPGLGHSPTHRGRTQSTSSTSSKGKKAHGTRPRETRWELPESSQGKGTGCTPLPQPSVRTHVKCCPPGRL